METTQSKQYISHEDGNEEAWICLCRNTPDSDGFFPCDTNGSEMEPDIGSSWEGLYLCGGCGRIIRQDTLEIVGQNLNAKRLD